MTPGELNRDYKRLWNRYEKFNPEHPATDEDYIEQDACKSELKRLYYADRSLQVLNKRSLLILLVLNRKLRVVPLHQLGIYINEEKL